MRFPRISCQPDHFWHSHSLHFYVRICPEREAVDAELTDEMSGRSWFDDQGSLSLTQAQFPNSCGNVYRLIARREICPRSKCFPKKQLGEAPKQDCNSLFRLKNEAKRDARSGLSSWVEVESLRHLSAKYCLLEPLPKSTIAAAFSPDGRRLASTHGDHTVKIFDSETGNCLKVLCGHQRTPWVVRFHPEHHEILASGSLDHEVRVWDAKTSECIASRHFYRPIASIAFHAEGECLAVASGHKLYLWQYKGTGESSSPMILLKTRRSLRAVNFHPHGAPFLLTAEVNNLDSSDPTISRATSLGCLHFSPPRLHMTNVHLMDHLRVSAELPLMPLPSAYPSSSARDNINGGLPVPNEQNFPNHSLGKSSTSAQIQIDASLAPHNDHSVSTVEMPSTTFITHTGMQDKLSFAEGEQSPICGNIIGVTDPTAMQETGECRQTSTSNQDTLYTNIRPLPSISNTYELPDPVTSQQELSGFSQRHFLSNGYPIYFELPYVQGWLVSRGQTRIHPRLPLSSRMHDHSQGISGVHYAPFTSNSFIGNRGIPVPSSAIPPTINRSLVLSGSGMQQRLGDVILSPENGIPNSHQSVDFIPIVGVIPSELSVPFTAAPGAELPCTVKLRIWSYDAKNPCEPLDDGKCRLNISHAVLCSEMGAHVSPCGKYLAACVACVLPKVEAEPGFVSQLNQDVGGDGSSPTRHPNLAHEILYELRIYSLEKSTFGSVLVSRAVRAAHCLTSIQFSPASEHILLAYGRRHSSLLKSIVINGEVSVPVYTVLEVYRVSDLELIGVLPSAEDEVNVACFHPLVGGGLVYGTKEGKLRILQYDGAYKVNCGRSNIFPASSIVEVQTYALEC